MAACDTDEYQDYQFEQDRSIEVSSADQLSAPDAQPTIVLGSSGGELLAKSGPLLASDDFAPPAQNFGPGTHSISIPALSCVAQGGAISGDLNGCEGGTTTRANGDSEFPCAITAEAPDVRTTFICPLELPSGAKINSVTAHGYDDSSDAYMEAAIWRTSNAHFAPDYFSPSFEGQWQSSGLASTPGAFSFPVYLNTDPAHTVSAGYRYTLGFGLEYSTMTVLAFGFEVTYTVS
ncbi:hypothetical protein G6O69_15890 [Pseudenhygromyxa sp. WMMC2535]|uniref:hypothetical protein n=1 Tax=Pseudenhygromyxa sp. WMMC2535 TaxID=2712867 RepID=UPI001595DAA4|nr:hypothetical protein [Pseudenhygromyxa sp. WMMC2535]NVB39325.1 hypothetical protein [Pseudenhygromyxa sp. WMMC2535]